MKQKSTLTKIVIASAVMLFSIPAFAQLSLSAGAKASADSEKGADADGDGDAKADASGADMDTKADASEEAAPPPPPPPIPEPEPIMEVAPPADTGGTAGFNKGFYIKSNDGNNKLVIHGRVKTRWDLLSDEYSAQDLDSGEWGTNHDMHSAFSTNYARIILAGHVFTPKLGYVLYWDFIRSIPIYALAKWTFIPKKLEIKAGLFKRPISRHYLTSSAKKGFIDNPIGNMGHGLDTGIQVGNNFEKAIGLEWAVGVFNGSLGAGGDFSPVLTGRIGYNNGIKGYDDTDFVGGPLRYGVAFSASTEFDHNDNDMTQHFVSLDGMLKVSGFTLSAALTLRSDTIDGFWDIDDDAGAVGLTQIGSYIQGGYLIKNMFEPTARYSFTHQYDVDDDLRQQITGGLTIHFFDNHRFKWENNLSLLTARGPDPDPANAGDIISYQDILFSSQLELAF